jgi:hypothetical protein
MRARPIAKRSCPLLPFAALCCSALIALAGCATGPPPAISPGELANAELFPYFKLYWAGKRFEGAPLTAVGGRAGYSPRTGESVYYGNCAPRTSLLGEGTCRLPLEVTTLVYAPHDNSDLGAQRNAILRSVPAVIFDHERSIDLYTGHLEIELRAQTPAAARQAVAALRPLNASGSVSEPLPAPTYCPSLQGSIPASLATLLANLPDRACQRSRILETSP